MPRNSTRLRFVLGTGLTLMAICFGGVLVQAISEPRLASAHLTLAGFPMTRLNFAAPPLGLTVNDAGDLPDTNIGDGVCDTSAAVGDQCTLRAAIQESNAVSGTDTITFTLPSSSTIILNTVLPTINSDLTIDGSGSSQLTVTRSTAGGTPVFRLFDIDFQRTVSITDLTISNGSAPPPTGGPSAAGGGGVRNGGTLTMSNCTLKDNSGDNGGAVLNFGALTLNNCNLYGNSSSRAALSQTGLAPVGLITTINNSNIGGLGPGQPNMGAGVSIQFGVVVMNGGSVVGNQGGVSLSGGDNSRVNAALRGVRITNNSSHGLLLGATSVVSDCLIANNSSEDDSGGMRTGGSGTITVINTTISGNTSRRGGGGLTASSDVRLINVTVTDNRSDSDNDFGEQGGGINIQGGLLIHNSIVAGNFHGTGPGAVPDDMNGMVNANSSFNLIGATTGLSPISNGTNGNKIGTTAAPINALLGPLADNGGPTLTHAPLPGSPILDAGNNDVAKDRDGNSLVTDQRGTGRFANSAIAGVGVVDMGAYESHPTFEDIQDRTTNEDTPLTMAFSLGDSGVAISSVTATSSNQGLIPNANVIVGNEARVRSLHLTPTPSLNGSTQITVTVTESGGAIKTDSFQVNVTPVNDLPGFTVGPTDTVDEDFGPRIVNNWATNISTGPPDESGQIMSFQITNNTFPNLFLVAPAIGPDGTLTYTTNPNVSGNATITVVGQDNGGTANGGKDTTAPQTFSIVVNAVNDAPVNSVPGAQSVAPNGTLTFSMNNGRRIAVSDDSGGAQVTLTCSNGTASLNGTGGINFTVGDGVADQTMTFSGTIQTINTRLNGMSFRPTQDFLGAASLQILTEDLGNFGSGGPMSDTDTINITVEPQAISFLSSTYVTDESAGFAVVTVGRTGDTALSATVRYATSDHSESTGIVPCATINGIASSRCDFTTANGTLTFNAGDSSKTFIVLISQDAFTEGPETLPLTLSNPTNGTLGTITNASLRIDDDPIEPNTNVINDPATFVKQHYHDFLNREADPGGLAFWSNQILSCSSDASCIEVKRINVSAAFFLSIEFQETGFFVYRTYKTAFGNPPGAPVPLRFNEFLPDAQQIAKGVQVGIGDWESQLEANKVSYLTSVVLRTRFTSEYPTSLTPAQFVDSLFAKTGITPSTAERQAAINEFGGAANTVIISARGRALRHVVDNNALKQQETNPAFVFMQYIGYMRRNPDATPDSNFDGWQFWLNKLNQFNGNFVDAEMVKAFIVSSEYRSRFGQP